MQQQPFSEMEMPTQSSPNHSHHQPSQNYHHHQQQHQNNTQASAGPSASKRMSSQSTNISTSSALNPNGLSAIASSSHCVSSSSSSPPPNHVSRHGYANLPTSGGSTTPPGAHCLPAEASFTSLSCYNNNNPGDAMTSGASAHAVLHCSHLSSGQQHPVQGYLQGIFSNPFIIVVIIKSKFSLFGILY